MKIPSHHGPKTDQKYDTGNQTIDLLLNRASCRSFADRDIPDDILETVLKAGVHAATGGNLQPWSIIKIKNKNTSQQLADMCHQPFIGTAPVNLMFCIDWHRLHRWAELENAPFTASASFRHFWISFQDVIIAAQNICTAADALGMGSVYIGTVMDFMKDIKDMLKLPDEVLPVVLLTMGYPKSELNTRRKLGTDIVVHNETYQHIPDNALKDVFKEKYENRRIELSDEKLEQIHSVCANVHGNKFADHCIEKIKDEGFINAVQRYFGMHYVADWMSSGNEDMMNIIESMGFKWFRNFNPDEHKR